MGFSSVDLDLPFLENSEKDEPLEPLELSGGKQPQIEYGTPNRAWDGENYDNWNETENGDRDGVHTFQASAVLS